MKQWDKCVFGAKKTSTSLDVLAALKRHAPTHQSRRVPDYKGLSVKGGLGGSENDPSSGERTDKSLNHSFDSMGPISSFKSKSVEPNSDRPEEKVDFCVFMFHHIPNKHFFGIILFLSKLDSSPLWTPGARQNNPCPCSC